ncbi:MAG: ABC transporter permease [Acidobacteria bacterium]|nr:ABC transporter permease [Acidobacteriota bacterium]
MPERTETEHFDLLIEAARTEKNYWRDLWRYRELFYFLAWRDILVRYKQTVIGIMWALIRPLLTMLIFTFVFNKIANLSAPGLAPYSLFVFAAMLPWQFFSNALSDASYSLIGNANLISKVYFPRMIVPAGSVITSLVDFLITLGLMALMMFWHGFLPDWRLLTLPLFMALAFGSAFGAGLWLCALNVRYRDFRFILPFIVQFGLYISPVGFSSKVVPQNLQTLYNCNPMVGVIDGFRWALLQGKTPLTGSALITSLLITVLLCVTGVRYFRRTEKTFADEI